MPLEILSRVPGLRGEVLWEGSAGRLHDTWAMRFALTHLADAAAMMADDRRAGLLYGAADVLVERNHSSLPVYQRLTERCRSATSAQGGRDAFEAILREGRALRPEEVVALATG